MGVTNLLGICSGIAAIAVFFHGDALSGYMLVLICYLLFSVAQNESEISRLQDRIAAIDNLLFSVAQNESEISRLQDRIAAIDKRKFVVIERPTHLVIS
jgi:Tfp pilus assembly protein PilN